MNLKQGIMMGLLGFCAGIVGAFAMMQLSQKAVKAEQFVLVDKKGKIHAVLGFTNLGKPSLGLWDEDGKNRIILGFIREGVPGLGLNDEKGARRVNLELKENGEPDLILYNENREPIWSAP